MPWKTEQLQNTVDLTQMTTAGALKTVLFCLQIVDVWKVDRQVLGSDWLVNEGYREPSCNARCHR